MYNYTVNMMNSLGFHYVHLQGIILCKMRPKNWMDESSGFENDKKQSTGITRKVL